MRYGPRLVWIQGTSGGACFCRVVRDRKIGFRKNMIDPTAVDQLNRAAMNSAGVSPAVRQGSAKVPTTDTSLSPEVFTPLVVGVPRTIPGTNVMGTTVRWATM
jgi:hypothetical protein